VFDVTVIIPLFSPRKQVATVEALGVGLVFAIPLVLLRWGFLRAASLFYLSAIGLLATVVIIFNGGIHSTFVVFYVVLPISAAWLLGYRGALIMAGMCLASSLTMAMFEINGLPMPSPWGNGPLGTWATIVWAMIIAAVPVAQVLQILKEALIQSESAKKTLQESEERFRRMADTAPVMIWVSGPNKLVTFFNKGWLEFTGRTLEQELTKGGSESVHLKDVSRIQTIYESSFDARRAFQMEYQLRRADGQYRIVLSTGVPRFESDGDFLGYIGSSVDITDLKRAHEEHVAKQKLEIVAALATGIAHDFNNLMGTVLAHSELALSELDDGLKPEEELKSIRRTAIRGSEIVRQLMVYAGNEGETSELVDVSAIVQDILELLKVSVSKHVSVETDLQRQLPTVRASRPQIRQVVMNLFYNASEAIGDQDGVIRVTTRQVTGNPDSSLAISERVAGGNYVQLEISDTGHGMIPAVQAQIFERFFTTKASGSHGLGLATVQWIVQGLDGTIHVSSEPGKGTTFQIMLPCVGPVVREVQGTIRGANDEKRAIRGATILIVEDEDLLRHGVSKMLRKKGLSILEAGDGSAALDVIRAPKEDIDLILLDITLPGASSRDVYEEAKRLRPDVPVIVTSAKSEGMAAALLGTGIERFLLKPFSLDDLSEMIREILSLELHQTKETAG
jgi:two-component system cell cycle sensor histidine kinase/response regulator CckA